MTYRRMNIALPSSAPGMQLNLIAHRFGNESGPAARSVYLQAGLHADEHPGLLVLQHLLAHLQRLDAAGALTGIVTVVPYANPIGMSQRLFGPIAGRFDFENGENFNRNFPSLVDAVKHRIADTANAPRTREDWQAFFAEELSRATPSSPAQAMKTELAKLAVAHDIVLDLHCDTECVAHVYASVQQRERAGRLAGFMAAPVLLIEPRSPGGGAFDQTQSTAWGELQAAGLFSERDSGFSATIELRGQADVDDELASADAANLLRYLAHEGIVSLPDDSRDNMLTASTASASPTLQVFPLEGASHVPCPCSGLIVYRKAPGDRVGVGETIAEIVVLDGDGFNQRVPVLSNVDGVMVVRQWQKLVRSGQRAALLAGPEPLEERRAGSLFLDF